MFSFYVWVWPAHHAPIPGRLVVVRLTEAQAALSRSHLLKSREGTATAEDLALADYFMSFTTVPSNRLDTEAVVDLYPLRWQIELLHRRNKSLGGLARLPDFLPSTVYTWILGHLLAEYLVQKLASLMEPSRPDAPQKDPPEARKQIPSSQRLLPISPFAQHPWHVSSLLWWLLPYFLLPREASDFSTFLQRFCAHVHRYTHRSSDYYHARALEHFRLLDPTLIRAPPLR